MKALRLYITMMILLLMSGTLLQPLHPFYHSHEHHSPQAAHDIQLREKDDCLIDTYPFYQKISHEPLSLTFAPVESRAGNIAAIDRPAAFSVFVTYLLRAPPFRA